MNAPINAPPRNNAANRDGNLKRYDRSASLAKRVASAFRRAYCQYGG
jgi:hypothetical protein